MATTNFDTIKILRDDSIGTLKTAFSKVFYGAGSTVPDGFDTGYPDLALENFDFDIADYEIKMPVTLGANLSITSGDATVTASTAIFSAGDVGKLLWDGSSVGAGELKLIGKIATYTDTTHVELAENFAGTNLSAVTGYISDVSDVDHNQSLSFKGNFYILVAATTFDGKPVLPSVSGMQSFANTTIGGVTQGLNVSYVALNRISTSNNKVNPITSTAVPATITRINQYPISTTSNFYFSTVNDIPFWTAYEVNPFGAANKNFDKNTAYSLEIQETLPTWDDGAGNVKGIVPYVPVISATYGVI